MLNSFPVAVLAGTVLGFLAGLGVGGGSLLILWLTTVLNMDPQIARGINLLFFVPSALVATILRWRQKKPEWKMILPAMGGGCTGALLGSWISSGLDTQFLKPAFGVLLIITGLRELFYRPRKAK